MGSPCFFNGFIGFVGWIDSLGIEMPQPLGHLHDLVVPARSVEDGHQAGTLLGTISGGGASLALVVLLVNHCLMTLKRHAVEYLFQTIGSQLERLADTLPKWTVHARPFQVEHLGKNLLVGELLREARFVGEDAPPVRP